MLARNTCWLLGLAVVSALVAFRPLPAGDAPPAPKASRSELVLTGTPSCSARACHGGIEPAVPREGHTIRQNEYPLWLARDPHARAYEVLFNERSELIAENTGKKAHEDARCLACHANPLAADRAEQAAGVGCESCHGAAKEWLGLHTTAAWRDWPAMAKQEKGMVLLAQPRAAAQVCAGCHVGAAADPAKGLPARDVNHDLIAAGHPRLNFEFSAYLANLPRHWVEKKHEPGDETKAWAVGQVVSAEASLRLLAARTGPEHPWPEFSEYACFACHHDLQQPSRRQQGGFPNRRPGALPWGTWHFPLTEVLARQGHGPNTIPESFRQLRDLMQQPMPNRAMVSVQAGLLSSTLGFWSVALERQQWDSKQVHALHVALSEEGRKFADADWDGAAQTYLALAALEQAMPKDDKVRQSLRLLHEQLAFPTEAGQRYDSPRAFEVERSRRFREELDRLKALLGAR